MKRDQADASAKLLQLVLPTQASVKVFSHGDRAPMGYFISIAKGSEQRILHNVEAVADYLKTVASNVQNGTTSTTASSARRE